jgi:hypothetical protein
MTLASLACSQAELRVSLLPPESTGRESAVPIIFRTIQSSTAEDEIDERLEQRYA